ncbi:Trafficking protein particle complex subunit 8 [Trichinella patagoniensis]|uniref:Trafficking protein particle complex subunit 8 n=1 Tax=Trichinella patagoniensis TaxID=990121 RepID=A0A0V0ZI30_9BILA|nr:Trafficking protein particle complex subunit 8 [Trichinella patagoniensis]
MLKFHPILWQIDKNDKYDQCIEVQLEVGQKIFKNYILRVNSFSFIVCGRLMVEYMAEFIKENFAPMIGVLASGEAEKICQKNNLTFAELLQPFSQIHIPVMMKNAGGQCVKIEQLQLDFRDVRKSGFLVAQALRLNLMEAMRRVQYLADEERSTAISHSQPLPWFVEYRKQLLGLLKPGDHEFLRTYLACIFVISSADQDPLQCLNLLLQYQHAHQHQPGRVTEMTDFSLPRNVSAPKWFFQNVFKYYVLLHDVKSGDERRADEIYQQMRKLYGEENCHILRLNSCELGENCSTDLWTSFITNDANAVAFQMNDDNSVELLNNDPKGQASSSSSSFSTDQVRFFTASGDDAVINDGQKPTEANSNANLLPLELDNSRQLIPHPLSEVDLVEAFAAAVQVDYDQQMLYPSNGCNAEICLTEQDVEQVRGFLSQFCTKSLIPYVERQMKLLNEQVSSRKRIGKSLINVTKKWLSGNSSPNLLATSSTIGGSSLSPGSGPTTVSLSEPNFSLESAEMQARRLADLAFLFQDYEQAYQIYHSLRKEFSNMHAWLQYAGACEMVCLSVFLLGQCSPKAYPNHYMENAISTYVDVCNQLWYGIRAVLFSVQILLTSGQFVEAACQLSRFAEKDHLVSALFLEEAARCFAASKRHRKAGFHLVLAGHRYLKCSLRLNSIRCYNQALRMYISKRWNYSEDHINLTLGQLYCGLKRVAESADAFGRLLSSGCALSAQQQQSILEEYLTVAGRLQVVGGKRIDSLALPVVRTSETVVYSGDDFVDLSQRWCRATAAEWADETWKILERRCREIAWRRLGPASQQSQPTTLFYMDNSTSTDNSREACVGVGRSVTVVLALDNPLDVAVSLRNIRLDGRWPATVQRSVVDGLLLEPRASGCRIALTVSSDSVGRLTVDRLLYDLLTPGDRQRPPVAACRALEMDDSSDCRLRPRFVGAASKLRFDFLDNDQSPSARTTHLDGELLDWRVRVTNVGRQDVCLLCLSAEPTGALSASVAGRQGVVAQQFDSASGQLLLHADTDRPLRPDQQLMLRVRMHAQAGPPPVRALFYWLSPSVDDDGNLSVGMFRWRTMLNIRRSIKITPNNKARLPYYYAVSGQRKLIVLNVLNEYPNDDSSTTISIHLTGIGLYSTNNAFAIQNVLGEKRSYVLKNGQSENIIFEVGPSGVADRRPVSYFPLSDDNDEEPELFQPTSAVASNRSTLFLSWKADCASSSSDQSTEAWSCSGQSCCLLSSLLFDDTDFGEQTTLTNQNNDDHLPLGANAVTYDLFYETSVSHDFFQSKMCRIPVKLALHNCSPAHPVAIRVQGVGSTEAQCKVVGWSGRSASRLHVAPLTSGHVDLTAVVTEASVFDLAATLRVQIQFAFSPAPYQLPLSSHFVTVHGVPT